MPRLTPIAIDTNVLLDLANNVEVVMDCLATVKERLPNPQIIVLPTVILELMDVAEVEKGGEKAAAERALASILEPWQFQPVNCIPVGHGIVEQIGQKIRDRGLIPNEEVHDSFIVAEAALYGATMLISNDGHIKNIDQPMLKLELDASDVACPIIASPWKIVYQFFR